MSHDGHTPQYRLLVESLRLVAAQPSVQLRLIPEFAIAGDEIATTFDDAYLLLPQLEGAGEVGRDAAGWIRKLDAWFEGLCGNEALGQSSWVAEDPFWEEARRLAGQALLELHEPLAEPVLAHISWQPAG